MPDLDDPVFAIGCVAEDGAPQMALFVKVHGECYLFVDREYADPETRWNLFLQVHEKVRSEALALGLDSVTVWLPPNLPRAFARRLRKLGWGRDVWKSYSFRLR